MMKVPDPKIRTVPRRPQRQARATIGAIGFIAANLIAEK